MKQKSKIKTMMCLVLASSMLISNLALAADPTKKDETVFVTLNESGKVESEIVSVWLQNDSQKQKIIDNSILTNVKNVKGDEQPVVKNGELIWNNVKGDIYYQGDTNKALPLEVKISYWLDGKEISSNDLIGQSGEITIKLKLINHEQHAVELNGENKTIYTPLMTVSVINLPQDKFTNVKADHAQVLSDGNNQVVTFIAFPGLNESLQIDKLMDDYDLDLNLEDTLEITAHVEEFEMGSIYVTATPHLLNSQDMENTTTLDDLRDDIDELKDASQKLTDGSIELSDGETDFYKGMQEFYDGVNELHDKMPELEDGINDLAQGAEEAKAGADDLRKGGQLLEEKLPIFSAGATEYAAGAEQFAAGATKLVSGLTEAQAGAQAINKGINDPGGLVDQMNGMATGAGQLAAGGEAVATGLDNIKSLLSSIDTSDTSNLTDSQKAILLGCIDGLQKDEGLINSVKAIQAENAAMQTSLNANLAEAGSVTRLAAGANALATGLSDATLTGGVNALKTGATGLSTNAAKLVAGADQLGTGFTALVKGIEDLDAGMVKLVKEGTRKLKSKTPDLVDGVNELQDATVELYDGSKELYDGSKELSDNMSKFNREGIEELSDEATEKLDDLQEVLDRKDAIIELSKNYGTFSGLSEGAEGSVKFVIKTSELKVSKEETSKEAVITEETKQTSNNGGFFHWVKNLFNQSSKMIDAE